MRKWGYGLVAAASLLLLTALAQQEQQMDTVTVSESEELGAYLTDGEGRTLYLFVDDVEAVRGMEGEAMKEGVREEAASCTGDCLENWPPLFSEIPDSGIAAGEGVNGDLLYIAEVDGREQVVYNGWPLYYFVRDQAEGDINGQGVGDRWYIVSPEGWMIDSEGVAGGGQAEEPTTAGEVDEDAAAGDAEEAEEDGAAAEEAGEGEATEDPADGAGDGADDAGMDGDPAAGEDGAADETDAGGDGETQDNDY